jgi:FkbH-like protein
MKDFTDLKKNLKKDFSAFKSVRVALLGDTATQLITKAIRGAGYEYCFDLQMWEADFNQVERQIFDTSSELYAFAPDVVIIFQSSHKLLGKYNKHKADPVLFSADELKNIRAINSTLVSKDPAVKVIYYNYTEIDDSVFGNYANKVTSSFLFQLRKLNLLLMEFAAQTPNFHVCDISSIQNLVGKSTFFQPSVYINTEMVLSIDVLPRIAYKTLGIISAMYGKFKKCVVLDLDNTVWGGIIGDDGLENIQVGSLGIGKAFTEFQYWVRKLKNRGVIVAVCSKNTESVAKEPFEKHPDMVLKLDDIAVFIANWENKVDNIRKIQQILNIGFDSMVFLDDNPFERNMVRENIPGLLVPELPEDPAEYLEYLYTLDLFETVSYTDNDAERTRQYQIEAQRVTLFEKFTNEDDFLESLNMVSVVESFNKFNIPRVAQLSQRSNQFNLRTVRYTEADIEHIAASPNYYTFSFTLEDKFGNNGLICVVILQKKSSNVLFIDTWFMSCRVLKRGMENFTLNTIAGFAKDNGFDSLKGEYIATAKNGMVASHYSNLGFKQDGDHWLLNANEYMNKKCFISKK